MLPALLLALSLTTAPLLAAPPLRDILPHAAASPAEPPATLEAGLVPLGFSPQGHLAVIHILPDEAVGCFLWDFQIINLVSDAVVERASWQETDCEQLPSLEAVWAAKGTELQALMAKHGVQATRQPLALQPLPLVRKGDTLSAFLLSGPPASTEGEEPRVEVPLAVRVRSARRGEKSVGTVSVQLRYDMPWSWGYEVLGYLQSPFEERIVVVVRGIQRGWEGPPHIETVHLFGADLQRGF